jgi:hypothetical protein
LLKSIAGSPSRVELRQDAAILRHKSPKFADDFTAKSADNAAKFVKPGAGRPGFHSQDHREDHL